MPAAGMFHPRSANTAGKLCSLYFWASWKGSVASKRRGAKQTHLDQKSMGGRVQDLICRCS